jgi:hypothetical protein
MMLFYIRSFKIIYLKKTSRQNDDSTEDFNRTGKGPDTIFILSQKDS